MGVDCNVTGRLLFQNMGQLKYNRTFVISENEVSFELSSQICTQDNKKYVIQRIPFICLRTYICYFRTDDYKRKQLIFYILITKRMLFSEIT